MTFESPNEKEVVRTSLYLVRRAEALMGALKFFANDGPGAIERRLQFLAQSDFWEWELDNLIYSFESLAERSRTWNSSAAAVQKLNRLGIVVDVKVVRKVRWQSHWRLQQGNRRVAPVEMLREAIAMWNALVARAEQHFIAPMREKAEKLNIQTARDLVHLRKQVPAFAV